MSLQDMKKSCQWKKMNRKLKVVDLFAGVGGLSYGFKKNGDFFEIIAANDNDESIAKTYEMNHPEVKVYFDDIKEIGLERMSQDLGIAKNDVDIIIGGPPCQAYSTVGKRLLEDSRGKLFQEYYRILKELSPSLFIYENVKGLLTMNDGELFQKIISLFKSLGYKIEYKVLNAADYGTPQLRERVIIVGTKLNSSFRFPPKTHCDPGKERILSEYHKPYRTMKEALSDLPLLKNDFSCETYESPPQNEFQELMRRQSNSELTEHFSPKNSEKLRKIMEFLPEGGTLKDLPEDLRPKSGFGNTYSRLWWNRPSMTITRNFSTPSSSRCIHPLAPRPLTIREAARLQTFPDDFKFYGSNSSKRLEIGNAVPPFLSSALAEAVKKHFQGTN